MEKTILIKLSGEAMSGKYGQGLDFGYIEKICQMIKETHDEHNTRIGIVCGGGNFLRGRDAVAMDRETADYTGMLATVMNSLVLKDTFTRINYPSYNQSGLGIDIIDKPDAQKAITALNDGKIVIYGGGTGKPFFSTDTGAALRAIDINANMIIKLTNVDGVYNKDPNKHPDAIKYNQVTYQEVLEKKLGIMDLEAMELCQKHNIEIVVANINTPHCLTRIINKENIGTKVLNSR